MSQGLFFVLLLIVVLVVLLIVLILIVSNKKNKKSTLSSNAEEKVQEKKTILDILKLPKKIILIDVLSSFKACNIVFESFKSLQYYEKDNNDLQKQEWHSWQISLLLHYIRTKTSHYFPKEKEYFHATTLALGENETIKELEKIIEKYDEQVNIDSSKDALCKDLIWSTHEVSVLLYYMIFKDEFKKEIRSI